PPAPLEEERRIAGCGWPPASARTDVGSRASAPALARAPRACPPTPTIRRQPNAHVRAIRPFECSPRGSILLMSRPPPRVGRRGGRGSRGHDELLPPAPPGARDPGDHHDAPPARRRPLRRDAALLLPPRAVIAARRVKCT